MAGVAARAASVQTPWITAEEEPSPGLTNHITGLEDLLQDMQLKVDSPDLNPGLCFWYVVLVLVLVCGSGSGLWSWSVVRVQVCGPGGWSGSVVLVLVSPGLWFGSRCTVLDFAPGL